jgi:hypothetical protein
MNRRALQGRGTRARESRHADKLQQPGFGAEGLGQVRDGGGDELTRSGEV